MVQLRWSGLLYKGRGIFPQAPFGQTSPTSLIDLALFPYNRIIILSWCSVSWEGLKLYNIKNTNLVMLAKSQCMFWYSEELELLQKRKLRFDMMRAITTFQPLLHFYTGPRLGFSYQDEMRWFRSCIAYSLTSSTVLVVSEPRFIKKIIDFIIHQWFHEFFSSR